MVRSINITRTNEVVWGIVRDVYRQWHEKSRQFNETEAQGEPGLDDSSGFHSQQFGWMSADQIDLMSDEHKRELLSTLTTRITVRFDRETSRHQLTVEFNQQISRHFELKPGAERSSSPADQSSRTGGNPVTSNDPIGYRGGHDLKKSRGSREISAARIEHSVTVE